MKLSILIPTIDGREEMLNRLIDILDLQMYKFPPYNYLVQIMVLKDNKERSIGEKRNELLKNATGEYVAFVDDDDRVSDNYIDLLMGGIEKDVDCCSLVGEYTVNGKNPKKFLHYLACEKYHETPEAYHRYPNHLNCIRASIAKRFEFPEINHGEDTDWATQIKKSGLLKTEHTIEQTIYFYDKRT